jgi:hypothetical protein
VQLALSIEFQKIGGSIFYCTHILSGTLTAGTLVPGIPWVWLLRKIGVEVLLVRTGPCGLF